MLKRFFKVIRNAGQNPWRLAIGPGVGVLSSVFEIISLFLLMPMIQVLMGGELVQKSSISFFGMEYHVGDLVNAGLSRREVFTGLILGFATVSICRPILDFTSNIFLGRFVRDCIAGMRRKIFSNYLSYGKRYFDERGVGELSTNILQLTAELASSLSQSKGHLTNLCLGSGYAYIMLHVSWKLAFISLIFVPIVGMVQKEIARRINRAAGQSVKQLSILTQRVTDVLRCMVFVKVSNQTEEEIQRFNRISGQWGQFEYGIGKKYNLNALVNELSTIGIGLFLIGVSSLFFQRRGADFGPQFIVFFLAFRRFFTSLSAFSSMRLVLQHMSANLTKIEQAMQFRPEYVVPSGTKSFSGSFQQIELRNVYLAYGDRKAINGLSMVIPSGKMVGVVGPSGSGKSSLLTLLNRLYEFDSGDILIDGLSIRQFSVASLRQKIGYISQETYVFNETLRHNLSYGIDKDLTDEQMRTAMRRATLGSLLAKLPKGLDTPLGENGVVLSGGERQRLAIARNILKDPAILFLDEATSALDEKTESEIRLALENLSVGRTTVVVAHRLSTIAQAPLVYTLVEGRVVACESGAEVYAKRLTLKSA